MVNVVDGGRKCWRCGGCVVVGSKVLENMADLSPVQSDKYSNFALAT